MTCQPRRKAHGTLPCYVPTRNLADQARALDLQSCKPTTTPTNNSSCGAQPAALLDNTVVCRQARLHCDPICARTAHDRHAERMQSVHRCLHSLLSTDRRPLTKLRWTNDVQHDAAQHLPQCYEKMDRAFEGI
eukprot:6206356-Prymnesium_polylepis.3